MQQAINKINSDMLTDSIPVTYSFDTKNIYRHYQNNKQVVCSMGDSDAMTALLNDAMSMKRMFNQSFG